ncbi:ATP-grasp domain-containing protein, partial [Qipengyuania pacifica]|uniref:ATP-grasp domain-containing protein n=1 Tax=Qipengyuania pacifica TaxID=2860199 RepID=UPI0035C7CD83
MLKRGSTIGILGGGQLGRMMAVSAAQLGYRCIAYAPEGDNVVSDVCDDIFTNKWDDAAAVAAFAAQCDAVTWEFENVPVATAVSIPEDRIFPHPRALETAQDRLNEKRFVEGLGGRPAAYARIDSRADLEAAIDTLGAPGILKTRRDGYDGKGQWRIGSDRDAQGLNLPDMPLIYEAFVEFEAEFSVILVRGQDGEIRFWDSTRNSHDHG